MSKWHVEPFGVDPPTFNVTDRVIEDVARPPEGQLVFSAHHLDVVVAKDLPLEIASQIADDHNRCHELEAQVAARDLVINSTRIGEENWRKVAEGLANGLRKLNNECLAILSMSDDAMRETSGNTNVNCLETRIEEAVELISAYNKAKAEESK
jgi:hypothetical protein